MTTILNLTPHDIVVGDTTIKASGCVARVTATDVTIGNCPVTGAPVIKRQFGDVTGLPADDTPVIVSAMVLAAVPGRRNTFAPDTGPSAIRDDAGRIVAVTRLVAA